ncbi:SpaH/EbpB family LPXTG-anchored major pilin [Enterococcus cecorum]|uniref:SpaH/EbpB family LPXTG-anchored major pilin n=1 Tax=Enterococcus cecorum TaxID=44008 RepID=UPI0022D24779|nr:SpaH/EbpB family LPXTG-anchored major pilin [Enterococcus cecorum]CAI3287672.1 SpaH/EbpB family LPXTG-anchored major pilin [Enterococcus cecorum]CAI3298076.1 SpaH/EbpB family LPXTG-anchored major pilin [Enterococcus cecorum]CAI3320884.1 SpaH/EbpB family LPXTG-anchored major pilin [Enterococcus cecorum]CAI3333662.1 SpaH/EbpB family LPXTG-anchored major pilin [Enterococcus cecorum]CAI3350068.1 SpaH/EbpB family LPXTG-anchored major pilin [Enterococcus cecorum]
MKKLKLTTIFLIIVGFILSMAGLQKGYAAETPADGDTFDIVLTKMELDDLSGWPKGEGTDVYSGAELDLQSYFGTTKTLDGVYFEVHEDTAQGKIVQEGLTANGGQITFKGLTKGTYVIVENKAKSQVDAAEQLADSAAVPMTITLPVYKAEGGWFTTGADAVHVYPKNTADKPTINKVVNENDKHDTVAYGDTKTFKITSTMPDGIADYKVLTYSDQFSKGLSYQGSLTVLKNGESIPAENYELTAPPVGTKEAAIEVKFTPAYIETLAPRDVITITYQASINEDAVMGTANPNDAKVTYGHNPDFTKDNEVEEDPELHTGGAKFVKQDRTEQTKLSGAEFVVQNSENKYLKQTVTDGVITATSWVDTKEEATKFTSNAKGTFEVTGLAYGSANQTAAEASSTYKLVEVTAPDGYALLQEPIEFTVNASSYQDTNTITVNNSKVTIPQTGGIGSVIVIGLGLLAISFGLVTKLKTVEK